MTTETSTAEISSRYAREETTAHCRSVGEVYFAPAHEPPPLRSILDGPSDEPSPWVHVGNTIDGGLAVDWGADVDDTVMGWEGVRATFDMTMSIAAAFRVPVELLGAYEPEPRRAMVRVNYWVPTLQHAPWKQPGLTGRRYRIARRRFARARRDWIRAGRPRYQWSAFFPAANVNLETP